MAYGYVRPNWKLQGEADAVRQEARAAAALTTKAPSPVAVLEAKYDEKKKEVVYPAQLNVKYQGQWAGKGYRRDSKFGPMLVISLEQAVPAGSKLLITPRRQFPKSLG